MNGLRLAQLLSDQDEELDILGQPRKKRRGFGYIGDSPQYNSLEAYYRSKTPQEIFSQYTPSAPPPLNLQTPEPKPLDEFASVESEYTPYRPDKPIGPPTGAPTAPPLDPRDYRQAVIKDEPARPLFSGMLPSQFPEAYQIGYTPPTQAASVPEYVPPQLLPQTPPPPPTPENRPLPPPTFQSDTAELRDEPTAEIIAPVAPVQQTVNEQPLFSGMLPSQFAEAYQIGYAPPPAAIAPAASETPVAVNPDAERLAVMLAQMPETQYFTEQYAPPQMPVAPEPTFAPPMTPAADVPAVNLDAERLAAALQAQQQQQAQMMAAQAEMARQAEIQRQIELARIEEERRRAAAESAGVDDGGGR